jgi:hypothetical protein
VRAHEEGVFAVAGDQHELVWEQRPLQGEEKGEKAETTLCWRGAASGRTKIFARPVNGLEGMAFAAGWAAYVVDRGDPTGASSPSLRRASWLAGHRATPTSTTSCSR